MPERVWNLTSNLVWSGMPGAFSWWGPKVLLWLSRSDARQLVAWARQSGNAPVPAALAASVGDGCVKAGDQLMGVMPSSNDRVRLGGPDPFFHPVRCARAARSLRCASARGRLRRRVA